MLQVINNFNRKFLLFSMFCVAMIFFLETIVLYKLNILRTMCYDFSYKFLKLLCAKIGMTDDSKVLLM